MHLIDLRNYADHSVKIPFAALNSYQTKKKLSVWKLILAYWIDASVVLSITLLTSMMFSAFNSLIMTSKSMQKVTGTDFSSFTFIFSVLMVSYYFFSFFLNHGQSAGLYAIKTRIRMHDKSFISALKWSLFSAVNCLTGGFISIYFESSKWLVDHDYLYSELLLDKNIHSVNLLERTKSHEIQEFEEAYRQAA